MKKPAKRIKTRTEPGRLHYCPACKERLFLVDPKRPEGVKAVRRGVVVHGYPGSAPKISCPCGHKVTFLMGSL